MIRCIINVAISVQVYCMIQQ